MDKVVYVTLPQGKVVTSSIDGVEIVSDQPVKLVERVVHHHLFMVFLLL